MKPYSRTLDPRKLNYRVTDELPSVVIVGITAYILITWYLWQRHVYTGPKANFQLQNTIHHEILHHESQGGPATIVGVELDKSSLEYGQKSVKGD